MATIVTRAGKGSPLTHNEVDSNFTNLNTDKVETTGTSPVSITVNTAGNALSVTQSGAGNAINASGTVVASSFSGPLNGSIGATTPSTGAFTTLSSTGNTTLGSVGVGTTPISSTGIILGKNITGGANAYGVYVNSSIQSDVTSSAQIFSSYPTTQATTFTLGSLVHYAANQNTLGAGATVTNQIGFYAFSGLTGATNNFGFYSNLASATGRWNFYAAGTAANYFAGNVGIGGTTTVDTFRISGTASGATTFNGEILDQTIGSGITANYRSILSRPIMQNAVFTLTNLYHFYANPQSKPASPTVTNQYGYHSESTLTDATNNYGFYSNIASAANRWNFYAAGTAANYFAGSTYIAGTTGDQALNVNGAVRVAAITSANQTSAATMDFTGGAMRFLVWGASGVQGTMQWWTGTGALGATQRMTLTGSNNLGLATSTFGTSATNTFSVASGTAPTTGIADSVQYYSMDLSAGNTMPAWYTEGTNVGTGTPTANRTIAVNFNGTTYYLLASTVP